MSTAKFFSPPPAVQDVLVTFPAPHILLATINRPRQLNSLPTTHHGQLDRLFRWFDSEPSLRCAVITGKGRAFCAGADLKEWHDRNSAQHRGDPSAAAPKTEKWTAGGFAGLSNRSGKKPVIAAVNGLCLGGGMEAALNCDLIVAWEGAKFGLPEVTIGVVAVAGALPRLVRAVGRQRAAEMALAGQQHTAAEMQAWGLVNKLVPTPEDAVQEALKLARTIAGNSPDAVITSREGLRLGWEGIGPQLGTELLERGIYGQMEGAENMREGVRSFVERRPPKWADSKL